MLHGCTPWPDRVAESYRQAGYWTGATLGGLLRPQAREAKGRVALCWRGRRWTYEELDARADRLAAALRRLGLQSGDRVVVQLPNTPAFVYICIALFRLGVIPILALPALRRAELVFMCTTSDAVACFIPDRHAGFDHRLLVRELMSECRSLRQVVVDGDAQGFTPLDALDDAPADLPDVDPQEVAFFLLSGGTTGLPKLIPRTHDDYAYQLRTTAAELRMGEQSVYLAALPVSHNATLGCPGVLGTLLAGGRVVLADNPSPDEVFPLVGAEGVTLTTLMPPLLALWASAATRAPVDFSRTLFQVGGAMLDPALARSVCSQLGARLTHWFGMAEGLLSFARLDAAEDVMLHTQGHPLSPADEIRIVDDLDRELPAGSVGQLLARGPYTLRGYYRAEKINDLAFTRDGFLRTGDLARITASGDLVVVGRIKDVINRGGEKVPAAEVEEHLLAHPLVRSAVLVPFSDPSMGEKSCAVIVPTGEVSLTELRRFLHERGLAHYKLPDRLETVSTLPRTPLGKIDKTLLRARLDSSPASAGA